MRTASSITIASTLVVGAMLLSPTARAGVETDAEALIAKGIELREKGRDDEALVVFRQAFTASPSPRARAQVGLAEQALGMWVVAEADLVAALAAEDDPWIAKNKAALEGALGVIRRRVTTLEVRGVEHGEVYLDGVRLGVGPGPYRVEAGRRMLEVRAPGFQSTTRIVELLPGGVARETVTLVASPPARSTAGLSPRPVLSGEERRLFPGPSTGDPGAGQRLLGWGFVGTGAALLATGGVSLVVRNGIVDDYNASCPGIGAPQPPGCDDQVSASRTWLTVSILSLVGGGVFAAGGILLVAAAPSADRKSAGAKPRLACAPAAAGIACAGTF